MSKLSKSEQQANKSINSYLSMQKEKNQEIDDEMFELLSNISQQKLIQEQDPEWAKNNLEYDLRSTDWILTKVRDSKLYAQNLYAALCNNQIQKNDVWPRLKDDFWSCSWRYAGGIIADMREEGDYLDWYCSGIKNEGYQDDLDIPFPRGHVDESVITDEIRDDLFRLGWLVDDAYNQGE